MVYSGRAGGTLNTVQGGTSDYLCLHNSPEFLELNDGFMPLSAHIHGAEYENPLMADVEDDDRVPCTVCFTNERVALMMIPGRITCPPTWTTEYFGYLMTERDTNHYRRESVCVDNNAQPISDPPGSPGNGALFYHTEVECNGLECTPYVEGYELTCVVCTQ